MPKLAASDSSRRRHLEEVRLADGEYGTSQERERVLYGKSAEALLG
ncbi:MAG TPA: hypothetical protein VII05_00785 [Gaiellaceae bacterium]